MKKTKLLTGLITTTTLGASLITFASCSNARTITLNGEFKDGVELSSSTNKDGDMIIKFTFKDPSKYFSSIKTIMIGKVCVELNEFKYEALADELTIYKQTLNKYSGNINIWPSDLTFRPLSHNWVTQGSFKTTIEPKKDFECDTTDFNNNYLADVYKNPQIIIEDWFKGMDLISEKWDNLKTFNTTINYLNINKTQKSNGDYYTLDLYITTQINGVSDKIGQASGEWSLILHNVELYAKTGEPASWNICPYTDSDNDDWFIYLYIAGFNQDDDVNVYVTNESPSIDKVDLLTRYFYNNPTYEAIGVTGYNSNYYRKVSAVTRTYSITPQVVPSSEFTIEVPSTITNKNKALTVTIKPNDPNKEYIPKIQILKSDGAQIIQSFQGEEIIKGDYSYRFNLSGYRQIQENVIVKFDIQNYVPVTYSVDSSLQTTWSFPESNPKFVLTDPSKWESQFTINCDESLTNNLYKVQWHVVDQNGQEVYAPEATKEFLKEPGKTESNSINASFTQPGTQITSLKFEVTGVTQEMYKKVTYGDLPEHFEWPDTKQTFIYKNVDNKWEISSLKFKCTDEEYENWYTPVIYAIKNADGEIIAELETQKMYDKYYSDSLVVKSAWEGTEGPGDIKIEVKEMKQKITYAISRPKLKGHWSWVSSGAVRIFETDGKWSIDKDKLRLIIKGDFEVEETANAYDIKIWATNPDGETISNVLEYHKDHDMFFVMPNEDLTGTWEGAEGPGQPTLHITITQTE